MSSAPPRVAIDLTPLLDPPTGVDNYLLGLVSALAELDTETRYLLLVNREDRLRFTPPPDPRFAVLAWCRRPRPVRLVIQQIALPLRTLLGDLDVVHSASFISPLWRARARHVVSIYDMTPFSEPAVHVPLRRSRAYRLAVRTSARRADRVLVPTRWVAGEVERFVPGLDPARVRVVGGGVAATFRPRSAAATAPVLARLGLERPFLLCVGTIEPRKNVPRLLDAYAELVAAGYPELLVLAGKPGWDTESVHQRLARPALQERVRLLGYVPDEDLAALYAAARVFVYPSLHEGFGFPPLEAMASGAPVVAGKTSALVENLSGAAELVPPEDHHALAAALRRLLDHEQLRAQLVSAGHQQVRRFTWRRTAELVHQSYLEAAARPSAAPPPGAA